MMAYVDPTTVLSPRANWNLIEVLRNEGPDDAALAVGTWTENAKTKRCLASRWNGRGEGQGVGNPQSRGVATWFVLPDWMEQAILKGDVIPPEKRALVAALLKS